MPDLPLDVAFVDTLLNHLFIGVLAPEQRPRAVRPASYQERVQGRPNSAAETAGLTRSAATTSAGARGPA